MRKAIELMPAAPAPREREPSTPEHELAEAANEPRGPTGVRRLEVATKRPNPQR